MSALSKTLVEDLATEIMGQSNSLRAEEVQNIQNMKRWTC